MKNSHAYLTPDDAEEIAERALDIHLGAPVKSIVESYVTNGDATTMTATATYNGVTATCDAYGLTSIVTGETE